jgi:transposase
MTNNSEEEIHNNKIVDPIKESLFHMVFNRGVTIKVASDFLRINHSTAKNLIFKKRKEMAQSYREPLEERGRRGAPSKLNNQVLMMIEECIKINPAITLKDIKRDLRDEYGLNLCETSIYKGIGLLDKNARKVLDRVNNEEIKIKRQNYSFNFLINAPSDPKKIIFIDESGFNQHLRRSKAWSKKGTRAQLTVPIVRGRNQTLIVAANGERIIYHKVIRDRNCNGALFSEFMAELYQIIYNDVELYESWIIMDNAKIHNAVRNSYSLLGISFRFLSPYSYMLNPVENIFSKVKTFVRNYLGNFPPSDVQQLAIGCI